MLARGKCDVDTYKKIREKEIKNHFRNDSINSIVAAVSSVINANNGRRDGHETRFLFLALMLTSELLDIDTFWDWTWHSIMYEALSHYALLLSTPSLGQILCLISRNVRNIKLSRSDNQYHTTSERYIFQVHWTGIFCHKRTKNANRKYHKIKCHCSMVARWWFHNKFSACFKVKCEWKEGKRGSTQPDRSHSTYTLSHTMGKFL